MRLNTVELDERTARALKLAAKVNALHKEIRAFVGEANLGYDDGIMEVRRIASEGVIEKTLEVIAEEESNRPVKQ